MRKTEKTVDPARHRATRDCLSFIFVLIVALLMADTASAQSRCGYTDDFELSVPDMTLTANAMVDGRPVSPWFGQQVTSGYTGSCYQTNRTVITLKPGLRELATHTEGGLTYSVLDVGIPGIGMIIATRDASEDSNAVRYQPLRVGIAAVTAHEPIKTYYLSFQRFEFRFIKVGDVVEGEITTPRIELADYTFAPTNDSKPGSFALSSSRINIVHRPICKPRAKTVRLGSTPKTDFDGQYSGGRRRGFHLELDCDADVGTVRYYFEATESSPAIDPARGVVAVTGGAAGVGLQILDDVGMEGVPLSLNVPRYFGDTGTGSAKVLNRFFYARYVQTAPSVSGVLPGEANATIRIIMDYP